MVDLEIDDGLAVVTIDRPHARNAIGLDTMDQLEKALDAAAGAQALVIKGAGEHAFVSGGDLKELSALRTEEDAAAMARRMRSICDQLADFPAPVVAALNGHAFGGGAEVAVAADIRVAADDIKIAFNQVQLEDHARVGRGRAVGRAGRKEQGALVGRLGKRAERGGRRATRPGGQGVASRRLRLARRGVAFCGTVARPPPGDRDKAGDPRSFPRGGDSILCTVMGCRPALAGCGTGHDPQQQTSPGGRRSVMTIKVRTAMRVGSVLSSASLLVAAGVLAGSGRAHADDLVMHHVKYTVSTQNPIYTSIYYLDHEPAIFADYSHNPYSFTPHVDVDLAPGKPWSYELDLSKPDVYAMVVASTGTEPGTPNLHCDLAVDGAVVVSKDGPKGVLCSLRHW